MQRKSGKVCKAIKCNLSMYSKVFVELQTGIVITKDGGFQEVFIFIHIFSINAYVWCNCNLLRLPSAIG